MPHNAFFRDDYFSLVELMGISIHGLEIDHDLYWKPIPAGEIERIKDWL